VYINTSKSDICVTHHQPLIKEAEASFETLEIRSMLSYLIPERTLLDTVGVYLVRDFEKILAFLALRQIWKMTTQNIFVILSRICMCDCRWGFG
jgi:hypothetical protein